ncbi:hypothetical protein BDC45DRAFT_534393 [Circinella umbellata]|nr:hypothetical protein BDC45DRAFT_534393 [Circinella umbellata]
MDTALRLYPAKYFPLTDQTESDILKRTWIFIDKVFDNLPFDPKKHGHRADLLLKSTSSEFGCCEAEKKERGNKGTKEKFKSNFKAPKMVKAMLQSLSLSFPHAKSLVFVAYIISGLKIFALLLDHPSPYVCCLRRTVPMYTSVTE